MALHYHGLPLTPASLLERFDGEHVCISYATARPSNVEWAMQRAQSVMWDNGAFSAFTKGVQFDPEGFYAWVEPNLAHPHWAVVPDVIGGAVDQQRALLKQWPFPRALGAPVWHLHLSLDYLLELVDEWPRVCLGSSAEFWQVGSPAWTTRMYEVFDFIMPRRRHMPWLHGLRMLGQLHNWPLASADSVNVARNFSRNKTCPGCMAKRIDVINGPVAWPGSPFL